MQLNPTTVCMLRYYVYAVCLSCSNIKVFLANYAKVRVMNHESKTLKYHTRTTHYLHHVIMHACYYTIHYTTLLSVAISYFDCWYW
jgi:hypothetical protein